MDIDRASLERMAATPVEEVARAALPADAVAYFDTRSLLYRRPPAEPVDFEKYFVIRFDEQEVVYATLHTVDYQREVGMYRNINLADYRGGTRIGHGEVCLDVTSSDPYFINKPFVGQTTSEKRREGYATRRLIIMNSLSRLVFGLPLYSGGAGAAAQRRWEYLTALGFTEVSEEDDRRRWRFRTPD